MQYEVMQCESEWGSEWERKRVREIERNRVRERDRGEEKERERGRDREEEREKESDRERGYKWQREKNRKRRERERERAREIDRVKESPREIINKVKIIIIYFMIFEKFQSHDTHFNFLISSLIIKNAQYPTMCKFNGDDRVVQN